MYLIGVSSVLNFNMYYNNKYTIPADDVFVS